MRILIVNDDGITSEGIIHLAEAAKELGDVYVVAPDRECSAMSQRITVRDYLTVKEHDFPVPVSGAWSVSGTPADCVKVAIAHVLDFRPDYVLSGINNGYNAGGDIMYSGTVGAAMESIFQGIPAIAYSNRANCCLKTADEYIPGLTKEIMARDVGSGEIWNVNFPGVKDEELKGVLWDREIAPFQFFKNVYEVRKDENGISMIAGGQVFEQPEGFDNSDMAALRHGYISVGKVKCMVPI